MAEPAVHKRRGPLLVVLVANVLSICGTTMTYLAIPWFVLETTGSPVRTGLVLGVEIAGTVVASVLAGPVLGAAWKGVRGVCGREEYLYSRES